MDGRMSEWSERATKQWFSKQKRGSMMWVVSSTGSGGILSEDEGINATGVE